MINSYLSHLNSLIGKKTLKRKIEYYRFNFGKELDKIKLNKRVSVLELGPGKGEFIFFLKKFGIDDIDIFDNDINIVNFLNKKYKVSNSILSTDISLVKNKLRKYDSIVAVQLLEHLPIESYSAFIRTIYSKLKKGGYIIIVVPNANNPLGLIERYGDLQHQNSFTEQSLKDLVINSNISNYDINIKGYYIPPYSFINIIRIIMQKILHILLLIIMIINGGTYFKIMTPNIVLILRKKT